MFVNQFPKIFPHSLFQDGKPNCRTNKSLQYPDSFSRIELIHMLDLEEEAVDQVILSDLHNQEIEPTNSETRAQKDIYLSHPPFLALTGGKDQKIYRRKNLKIWDDHTHTVFHLFFLFLPQKVVCLSHKITCKSAGLIQNVVESDLK